MNTEIIEFEDYNSFKGVKYIRGNASLSRMGQKYAWNMGVLKQRLKWILLSSPYRLEFPRFNISITFPVISIRLRINNYGSIIFGMGHWIS